MLDQQDRDAALPDAQDVGHQLAGFRGVHAGGRLVEQQEPRLGRQSARDLEAPAIGIGQRIGEPVGARQQALAEEGEQLLGLVDRLAFSARADGRPRTMPAMPARDRQCRPTSTFSSTVIWLNRRWFWKVRAMPSAVMAWGLQPEQPVPVEEDGPAGGGAGACR